MDWINLYRHMDKWEAAVKLIALLHLSSDSQDTKIQHTTEFAFSRRYNEVLLSRITFTYRRPHTDCDCLICNNVLSQNLQQK